MILFKDIIQEFSYPTSFNYETFKNKGSYAKRLQYIEIMLALPKIATGSGRTVYKIDDDYVLKLAKNKKGLAQNIEEVEFYNDPALGEARNIFAQIVDSDPLGYYIIAKNYKKVNVREFKTITGCPFDVFGRWIDFIIRSNNYTLETFIDHFTRDHNPKISKQFSYVSNMIKRIHDDGMDIELGDWERIQNWGADGSNLIIIDYGLTKDIYEKYYNPYR